MPESGSPPLARELHSADGISAKDKGITPARAGITRAARIPYKPVWDHPRSRGNYQ
ncbi:hypothetical protein CXIVA_20030 [Clostridium sp. SY8519]|nr:hypothetical protein CXIVA_20030 [Clostridium sp. SY8519]